MNSMNRLIIATCLMLMACSGAVLGHQSSALAAGGNSLAAHECHEGGYLTIIGTNGTTDTTFKDAGQCVDYADHGGTLVSQTAAAPCLNGGYTTLTSASGSPVFASEAACVLFVGQGGTPVPLCTVSPGVSGCVTLTHLTITGINGQPGSISLTGAFSFSPITNCVPQSPTPCGAAAGGGTYTVTGGTFNGGTSGTFTVTSTLITLFTDATLAPLTCASAAGATQAVAVLATFTDSTSGQQVQGLIGVANDLRLSGTSRADVGVGAGGLQAALSYSQVYASSTVPNATITC